MANIVNLDVVVSPDAKAPIGQEEFPDYMKSKRNLYPRRDGSRTPLEYRDGSGLRVRRCNPHLSVSPNTQFAEWSATRGVVPVPASPGSHRHPIAPPSTPPRSDPF